MQLTYDELKAIVDDNIEEVCQEQGQRIEQLEAEIAELKKPKPVFIEWESRKTSRPVEDLVGQIITEWDRQTKRATANPAGMTLNEALMCADIRGKEIERLTFELHASEERFVALTNRVDVVFEERTAFKKERHELLKDKARLDWLDKQLSTGQKPNADFWQPYESCRPILDKRIAEEKQNA